MESDTKKLTLVDRLAALQLELTHVNEALLTAVGSECRLLEEWAANVRGKISSLASDSHKNH